MEKTTDAKKLVWKGEVTFEGTIEEFKAFATTLTSQRVSISISETLGRLGPNAGYMRPIDYNTLVQKSILDKMQQEATHVPLPGIIAGGIRSPHLHVGQEVLLVSKEQFRTFLGDVARQMTENHVEGETDFYNMIKPLAKQV